MIEARLDTGGLEVAFKASMAVPCVARKLSGTSYAEFFSRVQGMKVLSLYSENKPIGAVVFQGSIAHFGVDKKFHGKWASRGTLKKLFDAWGDNRQGIVDVENFQAVKFAHRLGLKPVEQIGNMVRFHE